MKKLFVASLLASAVSAENYTQIADKVAKDLLKTLGSNLKRELKTNGAVSALKFCNLNALKLTKKVSDKYGKSIDVKRVSLKNRNPSNYPVGEELGILLTMQSHFKKGEKPKDIVHDKGDVIKVYKPVVISKGVCLVCHGDIAKNKKLYSEIKKLYPHDKAFGYKMGDLRGAIVVTIKKSK